MALTSPLIAFDLDAKNAELETASPQEIIRFAWDQWGPDVVMQSSFGADSACLLHLATSVVPDIRVLFLETHYHFPETLRFKEDLAKRLNLNIVELQVLKGRDWFLKEHGDDLNRRNPALCCHFNKVLPMENALRSLGIRAYLTGIRRGQAETRRHFKVLTVEHQAAFEGPASGGAFSSEELAGEGAERIKVSPILTWSRQQVQDYLKQHDLPSHPLVAEGYPSIGCWPCTVKPSDPNDERSGRWAGTGKIECGLHRSEPEH